MEDPDPKVVAQIVYAALQSPQHPTYRKIVEDVADWLERIAIEHGVAQEVTRPDERSRA